MPADMHSNVSHGSHRAEHLTPRDLSHIDAAIQGICTPPTAVDVIDLMKREALTREELVALQQGVLRHLAADFNDRAEGNPALYVSLVRQDPTRFASFLTVLAYLSDTLNAIDNVSATNLNTAALPG